MPSEPPKNFSRIHTSYIPTVTTFSLHKIIRNAGIIRIAGIIQGRALYEEIRQLLSRKQMK